MRAVSGTLPTRKGYTGQYAAEFLWLGLEQAAQALLARPERRKVLLCIHDGRPIYAERLGNDWQLSLAALRRLERVGITAIGVYLGSSEEERALLDELFPHLVACSGRQLPEKLGSILRSIA